MTLAVAVSVTAVTEVASDATGICACRVTGCLSDTALTGQVAEPLLSPQPPVNRGFWLDGREVQPDAGCHHQRANPETNGMAPIGEQRTFRGLRHFP